MDTINPRDYLPEKVSPVRHDAPGSITEMPKPREMHHVHVFSDDNYDEMVEFYCWLFNAEVIQVNDHGLTFISYDDHDHRIVIIRREGWGSKPKRPIGVSHLAYAYASLAELLYVYARMKERGVKPVWTNTHGNSTSFYYEDPDGNTVETMMDNFTPLETQDYKRYYQFTEPFGVTRDADFDPDKMLALFESGVPDTVLLDREQVIELVKEGKL